MTPDPDGPRSLALRNAVDHLTGPLAAGARLEPVPLVPGSGGGRLEASLSWQREPLVLLRLDTDLGLEELSVDVTIGPADAGSGPPATTSTLRFAPYSERGATLPIWPFGPDSPSLDDARVSVVASLTAVGGGSTHVPVELSPTIAAQRLSLLLAQGMTARLAYLMTMEKAALRRAAREIAAGRTLAGARSGTLDRHGRDLGVARFTDRLVGTPGPPAQISTAPRTEPDGLESDAAYRRRLLALRSWAVPTAAGLAEAVNGPGTATDPPAGWLADLGGTRRIGIVEKTSPLAVSVLLVATGDPAQRTDFLAALRRDRLVLARSSATTDAAEAARMLTPSQRSELTELRAQLADGYAFDGSVADPALSAGLAASLALLAQARAALGDTTSWPLTRGQDPDGGSRYELGLGCDLVLPSPAAAEQLRVAALARTPSPDAGPDRVTSVLAEAAAAAAAGPDPAMRWLMAACGLPTVVPSDSPNPAGATFVSTVPMLTLEVVGPDAVNARGWGRVGPVASASRIVVRLDATQPVLQLVRVDDDATATVMAVTASPPALDELVSVGPRDGSDDLGLVMGYQRSEGILHLLRPVNGELVPVAAVPGFGSDWTDLVAGDFGGRSVFQDLLLYDRDTGSCALFGLTSRFDLVPVVTTEAGPGAGLAAEQRIGRWSTVLRVPAGAAGRPDGLLCYDRERGDAQLLDADSGLLRTRWLATGWRPGFTHLFAVREAGSEGTADTGIGSGSVLLIGYDREQGGLGVFADLDGGTLVSRRTVPVPPRIATHLVPLPSPAVPASAGPDAGGEARVVAYDRVTGLASVWRVPTTAARPGTPTPALGVPSQLWSGSASATVSASMPGAGSDGGTGGAEHAALQQALVRAADEWRERGGAAWTVLLDRSEQEARWLGAAEGGAVGAVLGRIGLPVAPAAPAGGFADSMASVPAEYTATLVLPAAVTDPWRANDGVRQGQSLVQALASSGVAAAVGLVTATEVALVVSVTALPGAGLNLSGRAGAGYRWYCVPVTGLPGRVTAVGAATAFQPAEEGLCALVVLGYQRSGLPDPYEIQLDLPEGAVLTLEQYEFLLNVVERFVPAGVQVSTLGLRQRHLDLEPDGHADPLPSTATHVYRRFRRRRAASTR